MKTSTKIAIAVALISSLGLQAYAAEGGNPKKGKHLYKKECKACHSQGGEGGELTPMSKTMSQWDRFFDKDKHKLVQCVGRRSEPASGWQPSHHVHQSRDESGELRKRSRNICLAP